MVKQFVELIYCPLEGNIFHQKLDWFFDMTVGDVVKLSALFEQFPQLNLVELKLGIYSQPVSLKTCIHAGDRVEIYRELTLDPKQKRRQRALES